MYHRLSTNQCDLIALFLDGIERLSIFCDGFIIWDGFAYKPSDEDGTYHAMFFSSCKVIKNYLWL